MGKRRAKPAGAKEVPEDLDCIAAHKAAVEKIKRKHALRASKLAMRIKIAAMGLQVIDQKMAEEARKDPAYIDHDRPSFDVYGPIREQHEFGEIHGPGFEDICEAAGVIHYQVTSEAYGSLCGKKVAADLSSGV
jgi:hypothetical protein